MKQRSFKIGVCGALLTLMAGCGSAEVRYSVASRVPATTQDAATNLIEVASDNAIVVNIPISKIVIKTSAELKSSQIPTSGPSRGTALSASVKTAAKTKGTLKAAGKSRTDEAAVSAADPSNSSSATGDNGSLGNSVITQTFTAGGNTYQASVIPAPSSSIYRVTPVNDFFSKNDFGVTKLANTDIPTSVSNEFTDQTQSRISAIGGIISTGLSIAATLSTKSNPGCVTERLGDVAFTIHAEGLSSYQPTDPSEPACWVYIFETDSAQADVIDRKVFESSQLFDKSMRVWPVPSCLSGTLKIYAATPKDASAEPDIKIALTISDPRYFRLVGIPDKGKLALHPTCDVDKTDSPVDKWSEVTDVFTAIEAQAKAISGARAKPSSSNSASGK